MSCKIINKLVWWDGGNYGGVPTAAATLSPLGIHNLK